MSRKAERDAWTRHVDGTSPPKTNKFHVAPKAERGGYASKHEMEVATNLQALASAGQILDLQEQVRLEVLPANERYRASFYVADFTYWDLDGKFHVLDAKGVKTAVYQLKKRMLWHFQKIAIEEV